jgi:hypothetical protein
MRAEQRKVVDRNRDYPFRFCGQLVI